MPAGIRRMILPPGHPFAGLPARAAGAILCDPPWAFKPWGDCKPEDAARRIESHYDTMDTDDIQRLPVEDIAADACVLFLWATWPNLREALKERLVAGPYVELFARASRPGWTTWGNEATKFDRTEAAE